MKLSELVVGAGILAAIVAMVAKAPKTAARGTPPAGGQPVGAAPAGVKVY